MLKGMLSIGYSNSWAYGKDATSVKANKRYRNKKNTYMWSRKREQYYKNTTQTDKHCVLPTREKKENAVQKN
jgi:phage repressor protein C with HTH and peptisase S24 domain